MIVGGNQSTVRHGEAVSVVLPQWTELPMGIKMEDLIRREE